MQYNEIIDKRELAEGIKSFLVYTPWIARKAQPGQFVILRLHDKGERFPLTLCDWDGEKGWIRLVVQEVGKSTRELGRMERGDCIKDILGPLGKPAHIDLFGKVICVAGGVGAAEIYPLAKSFKERGNQVICIIGFRSQSQLILEKELSKVVDRLVITTEDGSKGEKGLVTDPLKRLLEEGADLVYAVGPVVMMKAVSELTREFNVTTKVSLNPIMVDGTGMCGCCRVRVGGEVKFCCVEGPEFDGHLVDFEELMIRNARFKEEERVSLERFLKGERG